LNFNELIAGDIEVAGGARCNDASLILREIVISLASRYKHQPSALNCPSGEPIGKNGLKGVAQRIQMEEQTKPYRIVEELGLMNNIASVDNINIKGHSREADWVVKSAVKSREHGVKNSDTECIGVGEEEEDPEIACINIEFDHEIQDYAKYRLPRRHESANYQPSGGVATYDLDKHDQDIHNQPSYHYSRGSMLYTPY